MFFSSLLPGEEKASGGGRKEKGKEEKLSVIHRRIVLARFAGRAKRGVLPTRLQETKGLMSCTKA
jgi:hypothetical protein